MNINERGEGRGEPWILSAAARIFQLSGDDPSTLTRSSDSIGGGGGGFFIIIFIIWDLNDLLGIFWNRQKNLLEHSSAVELKFFLSAFFQFEVAAAAEI